MVASVLSVMVRRLLPPLLVSVCAALLGGCAHDATIAELQASSYSPHRDTRAGGEPLATFIRQRSAILIAGATVQAERIESGQSALNLRLAGPGAITAGATAIDARGYFLCTAAAVLRGPHTLVMNDGIGYRVLPARLVWRGDVGRGEPEVAVLHVDRPLLHVFDWAPSWRRRQPVVGAGSNLNGRLAMQVSVFGGRLIRSTTTPSASGPQVMVFHSAPVHPGDSGGPLTDTEGRLLGVNLDTLRRFSFQRLSYLTTARAFRPNPAWLKSLIDADFNRQLQAAGTAADRP